MCGIAGELQYNQSDISIAGIERANQKQWRRGPDSGGIYQMNNMVLGHRRLKIFDLSEKAAQPMVDHALGLTLVFNGAIYNYRELREELKGLGYHFFSDGDTEVLLKAYHAWGEASIPRLRGMFAFTIAERESGKLILVRDRLGIKPLYYATTKDGFRFASTLTTLLSYKDIDRSIDAAALHFYLMFHAVPEPRTLLSGIRKLSPGSTLTVHPDGRLEEKRYWQMVINDDLADHKRSEEDWIEATREALMLSIDRQLQADVPVGVLLSGGLDSSLIVAIAKLIGKPIKTFSIGFENGHDEAGDEFYYSDMIARQFDTEHCIMRVQNQRLTDALTQCIHAMSEPMTSHDNVGFFLLARMVGQRVKVALSGQGADELFAGYHWHQSLAQLLPGADAVGFYSRYVLDNTYEEYTQLMSPQWRVGNLSEGFLRESFVANGSSHLLDNVLQIDSTFALANGPLGRVDNMTMASSLETRVPFLDEEMVDLAAMMPLKYKIRDGGKYILKQLGRKLLPAEIVDRPKGYFPVPALRNIQGPTLDLMRDVLSPARVAARGLFDPAAISRLLDKPHEHMTPFGASKLWQVGMLEYWLHLQEI